MAAIDFINSSREYLEQLGYVCEAHRQFPEDSFTADLYAFTKGRSLGIFFPYEDHLFVHFCGNDATSSVETIGRLHEKARQYVNRRFPLPRVLRYKVPNIVSVAVSERSFPPETARFAAEKTIDLVGGERHSIILVDLLQKRLVTQGRERQNVEGLSVEFRKISPINRAYYLVADLVRRYDKGIS